MTSPLPQAFSQLRQSWRRFFKATPWLLLPVIAAAVMMWSAIATPSQAAYQVSVNPTRPVLGDTLSIVIEGEPNGVTPTVTADGTTYQAYVLGPTRYRALIPTSPNTKPGRMTLAVSGPDGTNNIAVNIGDRSFNTQYITLSSGRAGLEGTDYEFDRLDELRALRTPERYWNGPHGQAQHRLR